MNKTSTIDQARFKSNAKYSPFEGWGMQGLPVLTFVGGTLVARDGEIVGQPGTGTLATPSRDNIQVRVDSVKEEKAISQA